MPPLRELVLRDLTPVRPLRSPIVRALSLLPLAAIIVMAVPVTNFFRSDMAALGGFRTWGLSSLEAMAGVGIVALALRESIPGRALSRRALVCTFAGGFLVPAVVLGLTTGSFHTGPPPGLVWNDATICFRTSALAAVPALLAAALLTSRALPLRSGVTGALYGLGCGLIADAGLRLFCEFSVPSHVVLAHGGAILVSTLAGALLARVLAGFPTRQGRQG